MEYTFQLNTLHHTIYGLLYSKRQKKIIELEIKIKLMCLFNERAYRKAFGCCRIVPILRHALCSLVRQQP